ncbi:MAG: hypothetical protein WCT31_03105 [Candidatus Micrarchaeia archaeon]
MPPAGKLILELGGIATKKIGEGTCGGKTRRLEQFKDAIEKHPNLIIPPYQSLPIEFFMPALKRAGWIGDNNEPTTKERSIADIKFDKHELEILRSIYNSFKNRLLFIRSDERSAKGIGLYESYPTAIIGKKGEFEQFVRFVKAVIGSQFAENADIFRKIKGWPTGIGIMFMQAAGENFGDEIGRSRVRKDTYGPIVSIAGLTLKQEGTISITIGNGFGGGVQQDAYPYKTGMDGFFLEFNDRWRLKTFDALKGEFREEDTNMVPTLIRFNCLPSKQAIKNGIMKALGGMLRIAGEVGSDIYFEINSVDIVNGIFAVTQIDEHNWNRTEKPPGKTIWETNGFGQVVGSGILKFRKYVYAPDSGDRDLEAILTKKNEPLIITNHTPTSVGEIIRCGAIIDSARGWHGRCFSSHAHGSIREAGRIMMHNLEDLAFLRNALQYRRGKTIVVWADEYSDKGGIVLQ